MLGLEMNRDERWLELKEAVPFFAVEMLRFAAVIVQNHTASLPGCPSGFQITMKVITPTNHRRSKQR